mgnify:CR=1 FL=1
MRHEVLNVHKNGTAKLEHIFNQMRLAGLDKMCLLARDYSVCAGCVPVSNEEIRTIVDAALIVLSVLQVLIQQILQRLKSLSVRLQILA